MRFVPPATQKSINDYVGGRPWPDLTSREDRVFISHRSVDKPVARQVAAALGRAGVPYYLDEEDIALALSSRLGKTRGVTRAIEVGLARCRFLIGVITTATPGWWVPFEIGASRAHNIQERVDDPSKRTAYIVERNLDELPTYMREACILESVAHLSEWIRPIATTQISRPTDADIQRDLPWLPPSRQQVGFKDS